MLSKFMHTYCYEYYSIKHLSHFSDEFSHHKLLNEILNSLHEKTIEHLKLLSLTYYKFYAASYSTSARKYSFPDMSPLTKW